MADAALLRTRNWALRLLKHLYHEVYLDAFDDGHVVIECRTCGKTIFSVWTSPAIARKYIHRTGRLFPESIEAVAGMDVTDGEMGASPSKIIKDWFE